ncbi:hypothetical protein [Cohnella soli]|uniref:FRG domain-containing protein n=1 Tax=Cohnella soli TaxID=425005 RepID=A0ABW0HRS3_9BACL
MEKNDLSELIQDPMVQSACIQVKDNFGDYGIVGFFAMKNNHLIHFLFSCRVLNIGVEQWLYAKLGYPQVEVEAPIATPLRSNYTPNWICEVERFSESNEQTGPTLKRKCFMRGGCDLDSIVHYLNSDYDVATEFNYVSEKGFNAHRDHTMILRQAFMLPKHKIDFLIEHVPQYDSNTFHTGLMNSQYDFLIYSVLMDYTLAVYRYKEDQDLKFVTEDYSFLYTDSANWEQTILDNKGRITKSHLQWLSENFIGTPYSEEEFREGLTWLRNTVPENVPIIFLNGSEVPMEHEWEVDRYLHHRKMNRVLEEFCSKHNRVHIADVRKVVKEREDVTNNIRHYKREKYKDISYEILNILEQYKVREN